MKPHRMTAWSFVGAAVLALPFIGVVVESKAQEQSHRLQATPATANQGDVERHEGRRLDLAQAEEPKKAKRKAPVYRPPRLGSPAPGNRVGGGTRGGGTATPVVTALAPDHTGQTVKAEPVLYWFVSKADTTAPVFFTLIEQDGIDPLLEIEIPAPQNSGIQQIRLADYGVKLAIGPTYQWSIALVLDPDHRSKDVVAMGAIARVEPSAVAMGTITRVEPPHTVTNELAGKAEAEAPYVYAEAGLWYDAMMAISQLIAENPTNPELRRQRAALLEQVTLPDVAAEDTMATDHSTG